MKKLLYLTFLNEDIRPGYKNKIHAQCQGFSNVGVTTELIIVKNEGIARYSFEKGKIDVLEYKKINRNRLLEKRNIIDEFFLFLDWIKYGKEISLNSKPDIVYIRRVLPITPSLLSLLKYLKKRNIKIVYEYPTWPWEKEMLIEKQYLFYLIDKLFFSKLEKIVYKFSIVGAKESEFNKKNIYISNAINVDMLSLKKEEIKTEKSVRLITVAHVSIFHGYDRLIEGLKNYYSKKQEIDVYFDIVGPVDRKLGLENLVEKYNLKKYVKFLGYKTGSELDEIFNIADIGIGCLGVHRKGISQLNSLKNREFAARGIPFIFSEYDEVIEKENPKFILKLPQNDTAVDIEDVIEFYSKEKETKEEIRNFARDYLSWDTQMKKIIENL